MLNSYYLAALNYSIVIAVSISLIRVRKTERIYLPFLVFLFLILLNEIINSVLIKRTGYDIISGNIHVLVLSVVLLWMFRQWRTINNSLFLFFLSAFLVCWITENFVISSITQANTLFRILYPMVIISLSAREINAIMMNEKKRILKNAGFLICCTFILYFICKAACDVFYFVPVKMSNYFYDQLFLILAIMNLIANLSYALVALWIPRKGKYTLLYC